MDYSYRKIFTNPYLNTREKVDRIALQLGIDYTPGTVSMFRSAVVCYLTMGEDSPWVEDERFAELWSELKPLLEIERTATGGSPKGGDISPKMNKAANVAELGIDDDNKDPLEDILFDRNSLVGNREVPEGGKLYVSDVIDMNELVSGKLNLICSPPGSGKTTFIEGALKEYSKQFSQELLYLAPQRALVNSLKLRGNCKTIKLDNGEEIKKWKQKGITAMTYAAFGSQIAREEEQGTYSREEWWDEDALICLDELSTAVHYAHFDKDNVTRKALNELVKRCKNESNLIVTLSATPKTAVRYFRIWNDVGINVIESTLCLSGYESLKTIDYYELDSLLKSLDPSKRGMIYIGQVEQIKHAVELLEERGIHAVGIWSELNDKHPLNDEQRTVIQSLVKDEKVPDDVQVLIFNAAYETGLNIKPEKSHLDYAVVHNSNDEVVTQARGRYRGDIDTLYRRVKPDASEEFVREIDPEIIKPFLGKRLFKADKDAIRKKLDFRDGNHRLAGWATVAEQLKANGYIVVKKKSGSKRFDMIFVSAQQD